MGTNTVTGHGPGSVDGVAKGPGNHRNTYDPLVSPHIVAAGSISADEFVLGVARVYVATYFPDVASGNDHFAVLASALYQPMITKHDDVNGVFDYFDVSFLAQNGYLAYPTDWIITTIGVW